MDPPPHNVPNPDPQPAQDFPPPPPESGAGQNHPVSLEQLRIDTPPPSAQPHSVDAQNVPFQSSYSQSSELSPVRPEEPIHHTSPAQTNPMPEMSAVEEQPPPLPQRRPVAEQQLNPLPTYNPATFSAQKPVEAFPPPPQRHRMEFGEDDPSNPIHYMRDPHKLIAYLVPFPKPQLHPKDANGTPIPFDPNSVPIRFLIYTPAPPPLARPTNPKDEAKLHKVQRKWQEEVRSAKTNTAKTASWQGVKSKVTRGVSKAMTYTTSSNLDFLGRVSGNKSDSSDDERRTHNPPTTTTTTDVQAHDPSHNQQPEGETTHRTVGVEEMVLVYPPTMGLDATQMRTEFVNTMLRTKSKATRDSVIATGLLPVAYGIDILATLVWPFGGLGEIDTVWAYSSIRGAKTARSVTKRLSSSSDSGDHEKDTLKLGFEQSRRIEILRSYLLAECHKVDKRLFPDYRSPPLESDVLEAIGWSPRHSGGESRNWEDEQWETSEVKDDLRLVMHKAAKEWKKWCLAYEKDPEKAMKK